MEPKAATTMAMTGAGASSSGSSVEQTQSASAPVSIPRLFMGELTTHTDGIGVMSAVKSLLDHGVVDYLVEVSEGEGGYVSLGGLADRFDANPGYLNVVMRSLSCQGWFEREPSVASEETRFALTRVGRVAFDMLRGADCLAALSEFVPAATGLRDLLRDASQSDERIQTYVSLVEESEREWGLPEAVDQDAQPVRRQLLAHLDGNLLGPTVIALKDDLPDGRENVLDKLANSNGPVDVSLLEGRSGGMKAALRLLERKGWITCVDNRVALTDKGEYAASRGWSYGVPTSYMLTYAAIDDLLFGDPEVLRHGSPGDPELHVDRAINVKGSGGAHGAYFGAIDQVIVDRFNLPFEDQPLGFADMGCGDGTWLEHVYHLVMDSTERGRLIREHPDDPRYKLVLVGADYNLAALDITRARLDGAGIPHLAVFGDVNDPAGFRETLAEHGIDSRALLHGSSFLVHNRPYTPPTDVAAAEARDADLEGAYAWRGAVVPNNMLQQSLVEHFMAWAEIVGRHGLVILDLHDPVRIEVGRTLTNYILSHGLSDQFTTPLKVFLSAAEEAGLTAHERFHRRFPGAEERSTISVNYFTVDEA